MRFFALSILCASLALIANAQDNDRNWDRSPIQHVLLISIDGMHAVDFQNCAHGIDGFNNGQPYCPNLASLGTTGINYVAANTSKPSDSFPGLMNIVTGATPRTMGVYYDVAYDRSLNGPRVATWYGNGPGPCTPGATPTGFTTEYKEAIDLDYTKLNGGAPGASLTDGGIASLDPSRMDRDPTRACAPVYPWQFVRTNTIFGRRIHRLVRQTPLLLLHRRPRRPLRPRPLLLARNQLHRRRPPWHLHPHRRPLLHHSRHRRRPHRLDQLLPQHPVL